MVDEFVFPKSTIFRHRPIGKADAQEPEGKALCTAHVHKACVAVELYFLAIIGH